LECETQVSPWIRRASGLPDHAYNSCVYRARQTILDFVLALTTVAIGAGGFVAFAEIVEFFAQCLQ
jgi:hypothetical protein